MKSKFILKIAITLAIMIFVSGCSGNQENIEKAPVAVRVVTPQLRNLAERLPYLGTIHARSEFKVIAQVQGTVQSLPLAEGAKMKKNDVLALLYAPELEAAVLRVQTDRDYWKRRNAADKRLLEQKAIPPDQEEASRRASVSADAAYNEAASRLQKTIEKAAFAGTVLQWYVEPGQHVMPGQPLLLIGDSKSEIHVDVIEEDVRRGLRVGTAVSIKRTETPVLTGQIAGIAPIASLASRTMVIKIHWNNEDALLLPNGASIAVDFLIRHESQTIAVPVTAIADFETNPHLFLIRESRAIKQNIKTGIEEGGWVAAEFTWNGTDPVAVTNLNSLSDSTAVFAVPLREVTQ